MMQGPPLNLQINRLTGSSRLRNTTQGQGQNEDRGEFYKKQIRRARVINQVVSRAMGNKQQRRLQGQGTEETSVKSPKKSQAHMDNGDIILLITVALFFDALSFVICLLDFLFPFLGTVIEKITVFPLCTLTMYLMYKNMGVTFSSKIIVRFWGSRIISFIPYLNILPEYTIGTLLIVATVKAEEVTGLKKVFEENPELLKYIERFAKA